MSRAIRSVLFAAAVAGLVACAQPSVPTTHYYRLQVESAADESASVLFKGTLEVERMNAGGVLRERPLLYSEPAKPLQLYQYNYHFWSEPPVAVLQEQLIRFLRAQNVAREVVSPHTRVRPDYLVSGRILRLEQVRGSKPSARIELELSLREMSGDKLVWAANYSEELAAADASVAANVQALNRGLEAVYARFVEDLRRTR